MTLSLKSSGGVQMLEDWEHCLSSIQYCYCRQQLGIPWVWPW